MRQDCRDVGKESRFEKSSETRARRVCAVREDYRVYHLSAREVCTYAGMYLLLDLCISYLFFSSWVSFLILLPGLALFLKEKKKTLLKKRTFQMQEQFLDGIQIVSASLQAGYSVENAFREALPELQRVYREEEFIVREFQIITTQLGMNLSLEGLLMDLGRRSAVEDIQSFAEIFLTAKRSGGDLLAIIRNTVSCIRQKQETMQEIETCLAGKVMEQNVMSLVPVLILAYVKLGSPEFLDVMYESAAGISVMAACFLVYVAAYFWGRRIIRIEV